MLRKDAVVQGCQMADWAGVGNPEAGRFRCDHPSEVNNYKRPEGGTTETGSISRQIWRKMRKETVFFLKLLLTSDLNNTCTLSSIWKTERRE